MLISFATFGTAIAGPAKKATFLVGQPDGTTFYAKIYGDEFSHKTTDLNGRTITQDSEGYWCYAEQTADGSLIPSTQKVGGGYSEAAAAEKAAYEKAIASGTAEYSFDGITKSVSRKNMRGAERRAEAAEMILRKRAITREHLAPATKTKAGSNTINVLVLLVQFNDVKFTYSQSDFNSLLNEKGYSKYGGTGSCRDYFTDQFGDEIDFNFVVSPIATVSGNLKDYGGNDSYGEDKNPEGMVVEACRALKNDIDFSIFNNFGRGEVDYLFVFFAGGDEAEYAGDDAIWSHASTIPTSKRESFNGVTIADYACTSELKATDWKQTGNGDYTATKFSFTSIGTFCHEFSHMIGLMDMYDTDYDESGGQSDGLWGTTSVMDSGNGNNDGNTPPNYGAIDRHYLGISSPKTLVTGMSYTLKPVNEAGDYFLIDGGTKGEYFLIECRKQEGWDAYIGGKGMLAYHIDSTSNKTGYSDTYKKTMTAAERWYYNEVNCRPDHQCAAIITANPNASKVNQVFFPYSSYKSISASNGLKAWNGYTPAISITDITIIGADGSVSFNTSGAAATGTSASYELWSTTAIVNISITSETAPKSVSVRYGVAGGKTETQTLKAYESGKYAARLENLSPRKGYTVDIVVDGSTVRQLQFTTGTATGRHYIMFSDNGRNDDGTFSAGAKLPLVVNNSASAEKVEWTFDGKTITPESNGYYTVRSSGTLCAVLYHSDGSIERIYKKVSVK